MHVSFEGSLLNIKFRGSARLRFYSIDIGERKIIIASLTFNLQFFTS
jgi:hypothetical protein